jgi:hypothetical protein
VVYLQTEYKDEQVDTIIVVARTKLPPRKVSTIPRLELDALMMAVRLAFHTERIRQQGKISNILHRLLNCPILGQTTKWTL